ncbi:hypothetical protein RJ640_009973 [Escallonia rubra]|uniref:RING-type E3 ubiquitin transferase n=1 Tax=Escallonia rubra TaxID=112253 RepID=A0AA88R179_9ASTE|nr:hypothetical protein RJ640_009973 [Escallonia rubra]
MSTSTVHFYSRRLLLHTPLDQQPAAAPTPTQTGGLDANIIVILSVFMCALVCALGLASIYRCACRLSNSVASDSGDSHSTRLASKGIKKKDLETFPTLAYSAESKLPGCLDTECVICLSEFAPGESVRVLPKCNHGFHLECIDMWLVSHSSCPTCRHCLIETCKKAVASQSPPPTPPSPTQECVLEIVPLEPEGLICTYRI